MLKNKIKLPLIAAAALVFSVSACKKDSPLPEVKENELITTVKLKFTNQANAADVKLVTWKDLDGQGGNNPVVGDIVLAPKTSYKMEVDAVLNETANPVENIKEEVIKEANDHLFVFKPNPVNILTVTIKDKDSKNLPLGIVSDVVTTAAGTGTLQVILRHQPGVKTGAEAPGSTDFDAMFNVKIQ